MFWRKAKVETPTEEKTTLDDGNDWEASRVQTIEKSERRAWSVAMIGIGTTVLAIVAIVLMLPLKESVLTVIRVDNVTGVPDIVTVTADMVVSGDEITDKYFLAKYVRSRETYDWYTLQEDYDTVGMLSSPQVGAEYAQLFEGKDALDKQYGKKVRAIVDIVTVVPTSKNTGMVRFIKKTKRTDQESSQVTITKWVATVAYEYRNTARIKESARLINPFGFQVLSYRVDPEMVGGTK